MSLSLSLSSFALASECVLVVWMLGMAGILLQLFPGLDECVATSHRCMRKKLRDASPRRRSTVVGTLSWYRSCYRHLDHALLSFYPSNPAEDWDGTTMFDR